MDRIELVPITFTPYLKTVIWGGDKICKYKGIKRPETNIGESWEISAFPGHESIVADGPYKGMTIDKLVELFGQDLLGAKVIEKYGPNFPLLVKIIDAAHDLSVQVHPDDRLAAQRHGTFGKSEMWYIIEAEDDAKIYAGLNASMTPDEYVKRVADGTFMESVAVHDSNPGDLFFLPAGSVHAIGAGNLLVEIQQSSDITYRIYDYGRLDSSGMPRELHTDLAKDAIDYTVRNNYKCIALNPEDSANCVVDCEHFTVHRIVVDGSQPLPLSNDTFTVLICVDGDATIVYPAGDMKLRAGQAVLLPAAMSSVSLQGKAVILSARVA